MRTKYESTLDNQRDILNEAFKKDLWVESIEGVLNDSYLIYNGEPNTGVRIDVPDSDDKEHFKYLLLTHEFASSWHNTLYVIGTDDEKEAEVFEERVAEEQERLNREEEAFYNE